MQPSGPNITMPPQNNMNMMRGGWPPGGQHQMPNQRLVFYFWIKDLNLSGLFEAKDLLYFSKPLFFVI